MAKKKLSYLQRKQQEDRVNVKAMIWIGTALGVFIIALSVMLALD